MADKEIMVLSAQTELEIQDWVKIAQQQDQHCREIFDALRMEKPNAKERELKKNYILKWERVYRRIDQGLRWVVLNFIKYNERAKKKNNKQRYIIIASCDLQ